MRKLSSSPLRARPKSLEMPANKVSPGVKPTAGDKLSNSSSMADCHENRRKKSTVPIITKRSAHDVASMYPRTSMMTRSRAKGCGVFMSYGSPFPFGSHQTVRLGREGQIKISPMPDLMSPNGSSKVDINIECRTRKSLNEGFGLSDGSQNLSGKTEPEVLTSNNVIVALTITDQDNVIRTGTMKTECLPPPRMDRVASITIETGHTEEQQKKTAVEISIRPDLLNTIEFSSEAANPVN